MLYLVNKLVGWTVSPVGLALVGFALALLLLALERRLAARRGLRRLRIAVLTLSCVWLWIWSTSTLSRFIGAPAEAPYLVAGRVRPVADYPAADAIVLHGGGMGCAPFLGGYGEIQAGGDRVWLAARLWKAGKAPIVFATGPDVTLSTARFLEDLGVPAKAYACFEEPRNTEEEVRRVAGRLAAVRRQAGGRPRVLVVTSAWHMRRTLFMYERYAPEVEAVPAACDFENSVAASEPWKPSELLPGPQPLLYNSSIFHEWLGYWGYRFLRK